MKKTEVYDINAAIVGEIQLPSKIFGAKVSESLISQAIRVFLNNQRKSHAKSKNRSEVSGTTKKMWAQKGTGRARHGSAKAPIFVGGGVAHGPAGNQNYELKMSKKMKKQAMSAILSKFALNGNIIVIDSFKDISPKTKTGLNLLSGLRSKNKVLSDSKKVGIVTSKTISSVKRAFGNLPNANLLTLDSLNVYDISNQNFLIFSKKAVLQLK